MTESETQNISMVDDPVQYVSRNRYNTESTRLMANKQAE